MTQNTLHSEENSCIDTMLIKLLKRALDKENDDHGIFGAYVAMELRNLKKLEAQIKLRSEIVNTISRVVYKESATATEHPGYPKLNDQVDKLKKQLNDLQKSNVIETSENNVEEDDAPFIITRKHSWELL